MATNLQHQPAHQPKQLQTLGVERAFRILEENLPGFEKRPEQYALTATIAASIESNQHLVAEAPTGTGKSFAVALGILSQLHGTRKKAIVATANNNLLEQYAQKDFPFLESIFSGLKWARAKGKGNYACVDKGEKLFNQQLLFGQSDKMLQLKKWYDSTTTGDREEIRIDLDEGDWAKINADDSCTGKKCPFYNDCHYYAAKKKVADAQIIITNFDLVLIELFSPEVDIFPAHDVLVVDEAHELEDKAISKLERSFTERQVERYIKKAEKEFGLEDIGLLERIKTPMLRLFTEYRKLLALGEEKKSIIPSENLRTLTADFLTAMSTLRNQVATFKTQPDTRQRKAQENLMENIGEASRAALAAIKNDKKYVSWVEVTKSDCKVVTCPFRVPKQLNEALFSDQSKTVILLSATLGASNAKKPAFSADGKPLPPPPTFEWFRRRVGITEAGEFICPTPFDYKRNCVLYLPKFPLDCMDPNQAPWKAFMKNEILELLKLSQGRAFVLTTSSRACKELGEWISKSLSYPVKPQGAMPNSQMIEWFKSTPNSIIVGTASFWQGVSVEGDDLKLVIIDKIPFPSHTEPLQQAREAWYNADPERKKRKFLENSVNPAIVKLNQGFGRLIRTGADTGAVALMDPRLTAKPYGKTILRSLPPAQQVTSLSDERLIRILK